MAQITAPATADMISYLDVINGMANQLKSSMAPADFANFATTHNALSSAVLNAAAVADLTPYVQGSINIPVPAAPAATNTTTTP